MELKPTLATLGVIIALGLTLLIPRNIVLYGGILLIMLCLLCAFIGIIYQLADGYFKSKNTRPTEQGDKDGA